MDESYARLIWVTDEGPQTYLLNPAQTVTLGREPENGIVIPLGSISRRHAQIEWNGSHYLLTDLGSANGTYVNGTRVEQTPWVLRDGDVIQLHVLLVRFKVITSTEEDPFDFAPDAREYRQLHSRQRPHVTSRLVSPEGEKGEAETGQWSSRSRLAPLPALRHLNVTSGPEAGHRFDLTAPVITIGFAAPQAAWDIRLSDPSVSPTHARLELLGDEYQISDLNSTAGTLLNGEPVISPVALKEGDIIQLGDVRLVYRA